MKSMANVVNEHYFSYVFDKENHKIKYKKQPENYGMRVKGNEVEYYFEFSFSSATDFAK